MSILFTAISPVPRIVTGGLKKYLLNEQGTGGNSSRKLLRTEGTKIPGLRGKLNVQTMNKQISSRHNHEVSKQPATQKRYYKILVRKRKTGDIQRVGDQNSFRLLNSSIGS